MNGKEFESFKFLKLKYSRGDQIVQLFSKIDSPQEIRSPLFNLKKFQKPEKHATASSSMHWNLMNDDEFGSLKFLKFQYKWGDPIIQFFWRISSCHEIRSTLFNLKKFQKPEKSITESCRKDWNIMNNNEFGSLKLLKLKYRRGDQIIQPFCRIGFPQEIKSPLFNLRTFREAGKSAS